MVPSDAVKLFCIALRAVCANAAIKEAKIQSNSSVPYDIGWAKICIVFMAL